MVPEWKRRSLVAAVLTGSFAGCFGDAADDVADQSSAGDADDDGTPTADEAADGDDGADAPQPGADDDPAADVRLSDDLHRPRLLGTAADFDRVVDLIETDETMAYWYSSIEFRGSRLERQPPAQFDIADGVRLLPVSREVLDRSLHLGFLYQMTGEESFADRLVEEFAAVADYPHWNPDHFLDTAEMTAALAIGYDWCQDALDAEAQAMIRDAIMTHGLEPAGKAYRDQEPYGWWRSANHNWNFVCNGGITMGALALLGQDDDDDEVLYDLLERAERSIRRPFEQVGPNGGWDEGAGYWVYGMQYAVYYLSSMAGTFAEMPDYAAVDGMERTGDFPIQINGPTGAFNYGDGTPHEASSPELAWLATQYDEPAWLDARKRSVSGGRQETPLDLLWHNPARDGDLTALPLDAHFPGGDHAATFRTAHADAEAVFLGCKGGDNDSNHTALDAGTFVLDAYGHRWVPHWGRDDYNLPGYWSRGRGGNRWRYYRMRPEGQNTLVFDPAEDPSQDPLGLAEIETFTSTHTGGIAITDLTDVYHRRGVTDCQRGFRFERNPATVRVQDEFVTEAPVDCWWFMHTEHELWVDERTATLAIDGESAHVDVELLAPDDAVFERVPPEPLPTSPDPDGQADNPGMKLGISLEDVTETTIAVQLTPVPDEDFEAPATAPVTPLAEWEAPSG